MTRNTLFKIRKGKAPATDKGALVSLRKFLENAGVTPKEKKKS
jgi:hypothetical protein